MKKLIFSALMLASFSNYAQQNSKVVTNSEPSYVQGDDELYKYMYFNLKFTEEAKAKNIEGEVTISFDVKTDSTTTNIIIFKGLGYGIDEEVKKIISQLKFIPALQNGIPVKMNTMYSFPIKAH
jgi:protein TonB